MIDKLKMTASVAVLAVVFLTGSIVLMGGPANSYPGDSASDHPKWDYNTVNVEAASLQGKLGELSQSGWDVFSIERTDSYVDQGNDGKTRLIVEKFQVTARKRIP